MVVSTDAFSRRMRVLVTGGAGFIGSHFAKRLAARGRRGRRPRQADLLRQPGEPRRRRRRVRRRRHLRRGRGRRRAGAGCDASSTSPPRRTSTARSSARPSSSRPTCSARTCCSSWARETGVRLVQVSTDEVYGDVPEGERSREDDPLRPSSPYSASKAGGDLQVLAAVRTLRGRRLHHARREHLRPEPVPREADPALRHERARRRAAAGLRRRPPAPRVAPRRRPLRRGRARPPRGRAPARSTTSAARSTRTSRSRRASSS